MPNNPYDYTIANALEKPLADDIDALQSEISRTMRDMILYTSGTRLQTGALSSFAPTNVVGFLGDSFRISSGGTDMNLVLFPGYGFQYDGAALNTNIGGIVGLNDLSVLKPLVLTDFGLVTAPASDPSNPRIDIIEVRYNRLSTDATSRYVLNTSTNKFEPDSVNKTLSWTLNGLTSVNGSSPINYKTGTPAGSPVAPTVTAGYIKIAEILVGAGVTTLDTSKVNDTRPMLFPGGLGHVTVRFKIPTTGAFGPPTNIEIDSPPGIRVVVVANPSSIYGATVFVFAGRNNATRMQGDFRVESNRTVLGGGSYSFLLPSIPFTETVDGAAQTALAGANALPGSAVAIGQVGVGWNIQPISLNTNASVAFDQLNLDNPLQISGRISILGGV